MANIGDVTARLRADVSDYVSGMQRAQQANQQLTATVNQGSQAFRLSEQGVNQAVAAYDRAMASSSGLRSSIDVLKNDVAQATADFKAGLISVQDYRVALDQARTSALALRGGGGLNGAEVSALNSVLVKTAPAAETAASGLSRVVMAAGILASQASGTGYIVGRLAGALGLTVASAPVVLGVLAGVAALVLGYKALTKDADAAAEATKKLETALSQQARASQGPAVTRGQNLGALAAEHRAAVQNLHDAQVMAQHERAAGPLGDQVADAEQRVTDALVARHNAMVPLIDKGQEEINSLKEQGFALTHTADEVIAYRLTLEGVPKKLADQAAAQERANAVTAVQVTGQRIAADVASQLADRYSDLAKGVASLANIPSFQFAPDADRVTAALQAMTDAEAQAKAQLDELNKARERFDKEAAAAQHPGGVISPLEASQLRGLGIDPNEMQQELDKAGAPLDRATADLKDRFSLDMSRVGREGIHALVQGIMDGTNSFLPLLQKILMEFLSAGISDLISGFFGGTLGVAGGAVSSGGSVGIGAEAGLRMNVHVGPSRDPMSIARDGQWQAALRESLLVARSGGFK